MHKNKEILNIIWQSILRLLIANFFVWKDFFKSHKIEADVSFRVVILLSLLFALQI
jgi:hypothetical protein